jgi:hypothetical protein
MLIKSILLSEVAGKVGILGANVAPSEINIIYSFWFSVKDLRVRADTVPLQTNTAGGLGMV